MVTRNNIFFSQTTKSVHVSQASQVYMSIPNILVEEYCQAKGCAGGKGELELVLLCLPPVNNTIANYLLSGCIQDCFHVCLRFHSCSCGHEMFIFLDNFTQ